MRERIDLIITLKINSTKHYNKQRGYMKDSIVTSPIFYMGNKKKIINKGLIDLFPDNIHRFIDLFSGSAIVAMNAKSEEFIINDTDSNLYDLYTLFKTTNSQDIISHIQNRIDEYGLARERTKRNQFEDKEKIDLYKKAYTNLRIYYNSNRNIMALAFPSLSREQIYEPLATEEIWDEVTPREGAVEALTWLHECGLYEIFICTSTDYRNIKPKYEKVIQKYFPFIDWKHFIVISRKQMVKADYIIDDTPHNLVGGCQKHRILITMPHNKDFDIKGAGIERADNWNDVRFLVHYNSILDRTNGSGYL